MSTSNGLAVVTGASSGIGREIARQLAARGFDVLAVARREERLHELREELQATCNTQVFPLAVDLAELESENKIVAEVERLGKPLKWLVNNAGYTTIGLFDEIALDVHNRALRVMLHNPMTLTHKLIPLLKQAAPANILNIASYGAFLPGGKASGLYQGSKAFIRAMSEMLAAELNPCGIHVTVSCPGLTETEIFEAMPNPELLEKMAAKKGMSAKRVASQAIKAAERGRVLIVHGLGNKLLVYLARVMPLRITRWLMAKAYDN